MSCFQSSDSYFNAKKFRSLDSTERFSPAKATALISERRADALNSHSPTWLNAQRRVRGNSDDTLGNKDGRNGRGREHTLDMLSLRIKARVSLSARRAAYYYGKTLTFMHTAFRDICVWGVREKQLISDF